MQSHHLATLVGQPTGGSQRGINGGAFLFLLLPHSGIEMDLPLIGTFPAAPMPDAGVTPDVPVKVTAADIAKDYDAGLAAALASEAVERKPGFTPRLRSHLREPGSGW